MEPARFRLECVARLLPPALSAPGNAKEAGWVDVTSAMGENNYNKHWPCSIKTWFSSSRCMESSLLLNWAYIFALTLSILFTSEPARSSFQVMSWIPLSCHCLINGPSSLPCVLLNALLLPACPPLDDTFCYSSLFSSSWLSNA